MKVAEAMASVGRSYETWRDWRKTDSEFRARSDEVRRNLKRGDRTASVVPDFPEFSERYLKTSLPEAHLRIWDVLNGREPRDLHPSMQVQWAADDPTARQIINIPPDHGKSTTWTTNYVTWLIHNNPGIRILVVSKTQSLAKKFLLAIKRRLTDPMYDAMHAAFAPPGGWKDDNLPWREDMIYVRGGDPESKDPTVQALGIRGHIYGARADLVILDDAVDFGNFGEYERQAEWIAQDVDSRIVPEENEKAAGRLIVIGTRVGSMDLYKYLRDSRPMDEDEATFSYFAQPAILDGATDPDHLNWRVLWPERQTPKHIRRRRGAFANPKQFQLIFQQADVAEDSTFNPAAVKASVNGQRYPGVMVPGATGHHPRGMDGLYVVGSWDPASSAGCNAMLVLAGDLETKKRWVLDAWNKKGALPRDSDAKLKEFTETYNIREWRIEKNAVQEYITQRDELKRYLLGRNCRLVPHYTHKNKHDPNMGVETMSSLFDSCGDYINNVFVAKPKGQGLIELPHAGKNPAIQELVNQLCAWEPEQKHIVQDLVMALWFAELGVREYLFKGRRSVAHLSSRFTPRKDAKRRQVVSLAEYRSEGLAHAL
jgi:hypothetical protein